MTQRNMPPGPRPHSLGTQKISAAHRGPHAHDAHGGFAANPALAKEAGHKGGEAVKRKYGPQFYHDIGKIGGETIKNARGSSFYSAIGRLGGLRRAETMAKRAALLTAQTAPPKTV